MDIQKHNNADIDWYVRMPTDPPLVDTKVETLTRLCQEEGATLEPTFPVVVSFHTEMGR